MALITARFANVFYEEFTKKQHGIVKRGNAIFTRNYHRVLKNGRGLPFLEAKYKTLPLEYPNLFKSQGGD